MTKILAWLGALIALTAVGGCYLMWLDEAEIPESLL